MSATRMMTRTRTTLTRTKLKRVEDGGYSESEPLPRSKRIRWWYLSTYQAFLAIFWNSIAECQQLSPLMLAGVRFADSHLQNMVVEIVFSSCTALGVKQSIAHACSKSWRWLMSASWCRRCCSTRLILVILLFKGLNICKSYVWFPTRCCILVSISA